MSIIIFSRPVHSGKTTGLLNWCSLQKNIAGILMPDRDGSRKILDLSSKYIFDIQCIDPENTDEPLTSVGRFHFYTKLFEKANAILLEAMNWEPQWLVIDEAGKLELDGKGFYPAIKKAVEVYADKKRNGRLLITVRDSLCNDVIAFFQLENYKIVHRTEDIDK